MTAQIVVLNQRGASVASDSLVTFGRSDTLRTMNAADKMFDAGPGHSVAVLHSGAAQFMQIHFEVLIAQWRRSLGDPLPTLSDYATSYCSWLVEQKHLFGGEPQDAMFTWLLDDVYLSIHRELRRRLTGDSLYDEPWDTIDVKAAVNSVVTARAETLAGGDMLPGIDVDATAEWVLERTDRISASFDWIFNDVPRTEAADRILLEEIPLLVVTRAVPWEVDATVVFVGYGAHDTFPSYTSVIITGIINDTLMVRPFIDAQMTAQSRGIITTFGQDEAVQTFIRAYNYDFLSAAHKRLDSVLDDLLDSDTVTPAEDAGDTEDDAGADSEEPKSRSAYHQELDDDFTNVSWEGFVKPMLDTVSVLSPSDMLRMAESLIGIQALRAATSTGLPSVGGPIDLALITRNEGVQWVRRKDHLTDFQRDW